VSAGADPGWRVAGHAGRGDPRERPVGGRQELEHGGNTTEAWLIRMDGPQTVHQWWGPDSGAMLYEERWTDGELVNGRILAWYDRA
jgi:hypothetical protein